MDKSQLDFLRAVRRFEKQEGVRLDDESDAVEHSFGFRDAAGVPWPFIRAEGIVLGPKSIAIGPLDPLGPDVAICGDESIAWLVDAGYVRETQSSLWPFLTLLQSGPPAVSWPMKYRNAAGKVVEVHQKQLPERRPPGKRTRLMFYLDGRVCCAIVVGSDLCFAHTHYRLTPKGVEAVDSGDAALHVPSGDDLHPDARTILRIIAKPATRTWTAERIAQDGRRDRTTVGRYLHILETRGLAHQPNGPRGGWLPTTAGRAVLRTESALMPH